MDHIQKAWTVLLAFCALFHATLAIRISFLTLKEKLVRIDTDRNPSNSLVDSYGMCREVGYSRLKVESLKELRYISDELKETALTCVESRRRGRCFSIAEDAMAIRGIYPRNHDDCANSTSKYQVYIDNSGIDLITPAPEVSNDWYISASHGFIEHPKADWFLFWIQESTPVVGNNPQGIHNCLVYDFENMKATTTFCDKNLKLDAIACQKDGRDPNLIIIIGSIGLASLLLQVLMVIGCVVLCCRRRARSEAPEVKVTKTSEAARHIRLHSLTSEGTTSVSQHYDHISRDPLHSPSLPNSSMFQYDQLNVYNEIEAEKGRKPPPSPSPYAEPYTDFVPGSPTREKEGRGRTLPPDVAPPCVPKAQTGSKGPGGGGPYDEPQTPRSKTTPSTPWSGEEELAVLVPPPSDDDGGDVFREPGEADAEAAVVPGTMVDNEGYGR